MKNILLAVTGLSPQVITETLYALHQSGQAVDEIHVISTRSGKEKVYAGLIGGNNSHFFRYLEEYGFQKNSIRFGYENVHVITDENGNEIADILSAYDNERLLSKCLELAFQFTIKKDTTVFFSIAGGRKTMSACLTLAAQLYGRPQDRLYHVLVSPEFENNHDFFYPPKKSRQIELQDNQGHPYFKETRFAQVSLINIPFVSIRNQLSSDHLKEPKDPGTLMISLIKEEDPVLTVNLISRKITYKTMELDMMPSQMALYAFFAMQKKQCPKEAEKCNGCHECFMDTAEILANNELILKQYKKLCGSRPIEEMSDSGIIGLTAENYRSLRSKVNKSISGAFGLYASKDFQITSMGTKPDTRYGILMDKVRLEIVI